MSNDVNKAAWDEEHLDAWIERFGTPTVYAEKIKKDPYTILGPLRTHFCDVSGKKILNIMGSNGNKAVALSLLGANVTIVDFSESNQMYAMQLAEAAGVSIDYKCMDVLAFQGKGDFDLAFAEMGILHYFTDLSHFYNTVYTALMDGGEFIIRDFHPISTKLISSRGTTAKVRKHKIDGDYFSKDLIEKNVSYSKYAGESDVARVYLRNWTLGEIVTEATRCGFKVNALIEEPNLSSDVFDKGIPKTFVLKLFK
ncbi:MAG TPA: SAM-dependent methyltransferase [Clostridiales bacterium UBA8960]|jgi:2-polyprenyl-3-methyl-5-hydroxy-6-metoxy-1,4-benzoquinol methylase|nr:SAM-dependent methyltransferase [Clostridiales bacterium UBA8960]